MKARSNWIVHGERNTSFFHLTTLVRRSFNRITCIENVNGVLIHDLEEVQSLFLDGFKTLYQTEMVSSRFSSLIDPDWCVKLGLADAETLSLPPSDLEITNALFAMKPFKAPGPDGIHVGFYQRFWGNVGASMKHEIKQIFQDRKVPHYLNQTLIALIPKQDGPTSIGHFRPISLCNSVYKILSKILV